MADEPIRLLREVADILVTEAEAAGLTDGEVGPPKQQRGHPFWGEGSPEVGGEVYPQLLVRAQKYHVGMSIPPEWVDPLVNWLLEGQQVDREVWAAKIARLSSSRARAWVGSSSMRRRP